MAHYDFSTLYDRRGHDATAYDAVGKPRRGFEPDAPKPGFDFIPLWVADMNFATCPAVTEALSKRIAHPLYGYFSPSDQYYQAICNWRRPGHPHLAPEHIGYENGVHGFVTTAVKTLTKPGDNILLHSPVYIGFKMDVEGTGRHSIYSPLYRDEQGIWRMNYEDMAKKIEQYHIKLAIFCSPHNPTGRVWELEELQAAMGVFEAAGVTVVSDEIWADLTFAGQRHIPTQMANSWAQEHVLAAYAPSKTFNLAGLIGSYHVIYNPELQRLITDFSANTHYNEMNVLSMHALIGGYSAEGLAWKTQLMEVIEDNARLFTETIKKDFDGISCAWPQGTYMLFLDCSRYLEQSGRSLDELLKAAWDVGVGWQDGRGFEGPQHIRVNLASPRSLIEEALDRLKTYVFV